MVVFLLGLIFKRANPLGSSILSRSFGDKSQARKKVKSQTIEWRFFCDFQKNTTRVLLFILTNKLSFKGF